MQCMLFYTGKIKYVLMSCICCASTYTRTPWDLHQESIERHNGTVADHKPRCRACRFWCHLLVLLRFEIIRAARRPASILVHAFLCLSMGLFMGFLYSDIQPDTDGVWNRLMGLFSITSLFALLGLSAIGTWQDDRLRFLRERASGYYSTFPYYMSKWVLDAMMLRILPVCLFVASSYALIGWSNQFKSEYVDSEAFYNASGCRGPINNEGICERDPLAIDGEDFGAWGRSWQLQIISLSLAAISSANIASFVTAFTVNARIASFATVLIILFFLMFSGALVSISSMGSIVKVVSSISPFAYTLEAINIGAFQNQCFLFNPTTMDSLFSGRKKALSCSEVPGCKRIFVFFGGFHKASSSNASTYPSSIFSRCSAFPRYYNMSYSAFLLYIYRQMVAPVWVYPDRKPKFREVWQW